MHGHLRQILNTLIRKNDEIMNKTEKETIEELLDAYWSEDEHVDTVAEANRMACTLGKMIGYKHKNRR